MAFQDPALAFTLSPYGADEHGLVCGFRFHEGAAPAPIAAADALAWPAEGERGFAWLHFNLSHAAAEPWLRAHAQLPDEFFELFSQGSRSTRILREGDALMAVISDVTFDFDFEASDLSTLWMYASERLVVTARRHPLRSIDRLRAAVRNGESLPTPVALLDHLLGDQADELLSIVRMTSDRIDDVEDELLAGRSPHHAHELGRLRRVMVRLQRLLAPEPSAFGRLLSRPPHWMTADDARRLQRAREEFGSVLRDLAGVQERIRLLQDEAAAHVAEQNNRSLFVLTLVTVLALPINLGAGLLGMNVGGVPFGNNPHGFWWVVALVSLVTGALGAYLVRRLGPQS
jgi:zinc transporter